MSFHGKKCPVRQIATRLALTCTALACLAATVQAASCPPCLAFDQLDKQVRDGSLPRKEALRAFSQIIAELDSALAAGGPGRAATPWAFPLRGYTHKEAGADAAQGYVAAGYDYFDGNRHGGHPSYDLFIHDRNQDSLDDRTGEPVTIVSMTGGVVVAAEPDWQPASPLRGGKYLWVYAPAEKLLLYYAHNRELLVKVGDRVEPGTPIATVGRSGLNAAKRRSPTHLHLTVLNIRNGRPVPENILPKLRAATPGK